MNHVVRVGSFGSKMQRVGVIQTILIFGNRVLSPLMLPNRAFDAYLRTQAVPMSDQNCARVHVFLSNIAYSRNCCAIIVYSL